MDYNKISNEATIGIGVNSTTESIFPENFGEQEVQSPPEIAPKRVVVTYKNGVNFRKSPRFDGEIFFVLPKGEVCSLINYVSNDDWCKVLVQDPANPEETLKGYIMRSYVEEV